MLFNPKMESIFDKICLFYLTNMSHIPGKKGWIPLWQSKTVGGLFEIHLNKMFFHKKHECLPLTLQFCMIFPTSSPINNKQNNETTSKCSLIKLQETSQTVVQKFFVVVFLWFTATQHRSFPAGRIMLCFSHKEITWSDDNFLFQICTSL